MLKIINIIALILSIVWMIKSGFDFEPSIAVLGLTVAVIGQFASTGFKLSNNSTIKGDNNQVTQVLGNPEKIEEKSHNSNIKGKNNSINQQ